MIDEDNLEWLGLNSVCSVNNDDENDVDKNDDDDGE